MGDSFTITDGCRTLILTRENGGFDVYRVDTGGHWHVGPGEGLEGLLRRLSDAADKARDDVG